MLEKKTSGDLDDLSRPSHPCRAGRRPASTDRGSDEARLSQLWSFFLASAGLTLVKLRFIADRNRFLYCLGVTMAGEREHVSTRQEGREARQRLTRLAGAFEVVLDPRFEFFIPRVLSNEIDDAEDELGARLINADDEGVVHDVEVGQELG